MIPFNYHHLYYFYSVAKAGSISKACAELNLSQPAVSTQLKQFERFLKAPLFVRDKNKLALTEEGRHIYFYAAEIFDVGREMMDSLRDQSSAGRLKIQVGASDLTPKSVLYALLNTIYELEPEAIISVWEDKNETLIEGLRTHTLDLVLSDTIKLTHDEEDIGHQLVARIPVLFCASRRLAAKHKHFPKDLNGAPFIVPTTQSQIHHAIDDFFISKKITPKIIAEIQDVEIVRRLVLAGRAIAPLNKYTILQAPGKEPLVILNPRQEPAIFEHVYLLTKKRKKHHPLLQKILSTFSLE